MNDKKTEAKKDGQSSGLALATGSAKYVTHYDPASDPHWVTRIEHGPYVAYHYIREAADQLSQMLNERIEMQGAMREAVPLLEIVRDYEVGEPGGPCPANRAFAVCEWFDAILPPNDVHEPRSPKKDVAPSVLKTPENP